MCECSHSDCKVPVASKGEMCDEHNAPAPPPVMDITAEKKPDRDVLLPLPDLRGKPEAEALKVISRLPEEYRKAYEKKHKEKCDKELNLQWRVTYRLDKEGNASKGHVYKQSKDPGTPLQPNLNLDITVSRLRTENCSSRVPRKQLDTFVGKLPEKHLGFPVFSVCDCNSFHTSGHLWGLYAIQKAFTREKGPVAVINIDQHADRGYANHPVVQSDGWGVPLMEALSSEGGTGCYLSTPNAGGQQTLALSWNAPGVKTPPLEGTVENTNNHPVLVELQGIFRLDLDKSHTGYPRIQSTTSLKECVKEQGFKGTFKLPAGHSATLVTLEGENLSQLRWTWNPAKPEPQKQYKDEDFSSFWSDVKEYLGIKSFKYVFVSVDLDCVMHNYTQWGDTESYISDTNGIVGVLDNVVGPLLKKDKASLIGFDVTGLPEHPTIAGKRADSKKLPVDQFSPLEKEKEPPEPEEVSVEFTWQFRPTAKLGVWQRIDQRIEYLLRWASARWRTDREALVRRKKLNVHDAREHWSRVVFYSGSIGHTGAKATELMTSWWYKHFVGCIARGLPRLLNGDGWKYILCEQKPPVFLFGKKEFSLYSPESPITTLAGKQFGNSALFSLWDWPHLREMWKDEWKRWGEFAGQLENGDKLDEQLETLLKNGKKLGGFECSASISSISDWRAKLREPRKKSPEVKNRAPSHVYIDDENGPLTAKDDTEWWKKD